MRRPLNWVVVCLSLLFLIANLSVDRKPSARAQTSRPVFAQSSFTDFRLIEKSEPEFGYVRADGSFLPLAQQAEESAASY